MMRRYIVRGLCLGVCLLGGGYWAWVRPGSFVLVALDGVQAVEHPALRPNSVGFFVINLDRSVDRWKTIQNHLTSFDLSVTRVSGIYGKQAPTLRDDPKIVDLERYRMYTKGKEPGLGEIGCYLSHRKALIAFLASDYEYGVIVEDDVSFAPDIGQTIQDLLKRTGLWDVCTFELHPLQSGWPLGVETLPSKRKLCVYLKEAWRAGAYLVNRWAAQKLVEKSLPMCLPWDMYYMRFWEFQRCSNDHDQTNHRMKFVGIEPRCAFQTFGDSEIEAAGPRQVEGSSARSRYLWSGRYFSWCSHITRFLYGIAQWVQLRVQENCVQSKKGGGIQNTRTHYSKNS
jgi:glycosyl transferase family 25